MKGGCSGIGVKCTWQSGRGLKILFRVMDHNRVALHDRYLQIRRSSCPQRSIDSPPS
jgi:hypothetical protein